MRPRRRASARRSAAVVAVAFAASALIGCTAAPPSAQLLRCMPGTWTLDIGVVADAMAPRFIAGETPVDSVGGAGSQTLTIARDLHVQVDADVTWTAAGTDDGSILVVEQEVVGSRTAQARLIGHEIRFERVRGLFEEHMTAELDGARSLHHYRVPSTAIIGRPGTVTCAGDRLTIERIEGVRLDLIRAG